MIDEFTKKVILTEHELAMVKEDAYQQGLNYRNAARAQVEMQEADDKKVGGWNGDPELFRSTNGKLSKAVQEWLRPLESGARFSSTRLGHYFNCDSGQAVSAPLKGLEGTMVIRVDDGIWERI